MIARSIISRLAVCLAFLPVVAAAQADKIPWARGPAKGALGSEATINVPPAASSPGGTESRRFSR